MGVAGVISRPTAVSLMMLLAVTVLLALAVESARGDGRSLVRAFECIHRHEGAWDANTGNGYQGGLQMTATFQKVYGADYVRLFGGAHLWPREVQIAVAIRAYAHEGFRPWPNTARRCGLT
jgi:hypothetical protein